MISKFVAMGIMPESSPPPGFDPKDVAPRCTGDEDQPLLSVAIDVSGRCNMACRYCAEAASLPQREPMTAEVLESAIRLLDINADLGIHPSVRIGSGEPMLAQPLLRHLHSLLKDSPAPIDVFITTNGTLIDDSMADWLASTGWRIKISLDGPQPIHDAWRRERSGQPTYERVAQAVLRMVERCPDRISVAAVLCRGANPSEVFWAIASLGIRRIELLPVAYHPVMSEQDIRPAADDVAAYVEFINEYAHVVAVDGPGTLPTLVRFEESVRNVMGYGNSVVPCGAGRSYTCVGPDGALYPCFRFVGVERYCIGDVERGFDAASVNMFRVGAGRTIHHRPRCSTCWGSSLCGGPCFAVAEFFGDGEGTPDKLHCLYKLADARAAFDLVSHLRENSMEKLMPFLPIKIDLP